jgi:hypothetical protein
VFPRGIQPGDAQQSLQGQLDDLLALANDVGVQAGSLHLSQERQPAARAFDVAGAEADVGHEISNTSPGR